MSAWCVSGCTLVVYMQSSCYSIAKQWVVWAQLRWSFLLVILFNNDLLQAIQVRVWLIQAVLLRNLKSIIPIYSASCHLCCSLVTDSGKDLGEQNEKLAGTWLTISVPILKKTATTCLSVGGLLWTLILMFQWLCLVHVFLISWSLSAYCDVLQPKNVNDSTHNSNLQLMLISEMWTPL